MNQKTELQQAMEIVTKNIREDAEYREGWKANIAMAFYDTLNTKGYRLPDQHEIVNLAAALFLENLIHS